MGGATTIIRLLAIAFIYFYSASRPCCQHAIQASEPDHDRRLIYFKSLEEISHIHSDITKLAGKARFELSPLFPGHKDVNLSRIFKLEIQDLAVSARVFKAMSESGRLEYIEYAPVLRTSLTPNDLHANQWHLKKIFAEQAWSIRTGNQNIKLAIVDDAVDINHEDLKSVIHFNASEIPNNGIDDDGNTYIDDHAGWQAFYRIGNPNPPVLKRNEFTHGTHCAGIAAAATNNGIGIASIGYNISIIAVSCADSTDPGKIKAGYEGIVYAADVGANVISLSWGGSYFTNTGQQVIDYAVSKGIVICAAAGNDNASTPKYPAAYKGVISVAATDPNDRKADFSNYGSWVDISAPGEDIWSSLTGGPDKYGYLSGTSMACPLVAGLCGLMLSQNKKLKPSEIETCLKASAIKIDAKNPGYANALGAGRINAFQSLKCVKPLYTDFVADKISICPGGVVNFTNLSSQNAVSFKWTVSGAIPSVSASKHPQFQFPNSGFYHVKLVVSDGVNLDSMEELNYIEVSFPTVRMHKSIHKIHKGESAFLGLDLQGKAPWDIGISDGSSTLNFNGIDATTFYFEVSPTANRSYFPVSVKDSRCNGLVYDTAHVLVDTAKVVNTGGGCGNFTLFAKTMNMGSNEVPHCITILKNNQYVISGITSKGEIGGKDIFLIKVNNNGNIIWTKYYGTTADETGYPIGVVEDANGDMYIYGSSHTISPETSILIKIDSAGTVLSAVKAINNLVGEHYRYGLLLKDKRLGIVGTSGITNDQAAQVFVMSADGTFNWTMSFDGGGTTEHFLGLEEIRDKLYAVGGTSKGSGGYGSMFAKMDLNGNLVWQKHVDYGDWDALFNIIATQNSSLMLGGWVSNSGTSTFGSQDIGIIHADTNGNRIWSKIIGKSGKDEYGGLLRINDAFYIAGTTNSFDNGNSKLFVIKMDINGNIKWSKIYGAAGERIIKNPFINNIVAGHDGSILVIGQKSNASEDVLLIKIDECGKSNCPFEDVVFNVQNDNTAFAGSSLSDLGIMPRQNLSATSKNVSAGTINISDKCPTVPATKPPCKLKASFGFHYGCAKDTVHLFDSSFDVSGKLIKQYKWVFYDASMMIGKQNVKFLFPGPGTYKTTLIAFSDTPNVCSDTIVKFITINDLIKGRITFDKNSICKGDSVKLKATLNCGVLPLSVKWYPVAYFPDPAAFDVSVSVPTSMWIRFVATDKNNIQTSDSVFITVNQGCCKYNALVSAGTDNVCLGDSVEISNKSQNTGATYKWYLYLDDVVYDSVSTNSPGKIKLSKPGKYTFRLKVYGTCQEASASTDVFCNPLPYIKPGRDTLLCAPAPLLLGSKAVAQRTYLWLPNANLDNNKIAQPLATINQSVQYTLTVKDLNTDCLNHDTINIQLSTAKLDIGNDTLLCEGAEMVLKAGFHIGANYTWSDGSHGSSLVIRFPGKYFLSMTDKCGTYTDSVLIAPKDCFCEFIYWPNAFSPNDNAINDFYPYEHLETAVHLTIFNRWGEKLADLHDTKKGWDGYYQGEIVQQDVYLYLVEYTNCRGRHVYMYGTFTLLR